MSNKTSDNVANIEDDIREIKESIKEAYRCYDYDLDYNPFSKGIAEMVERILSDYTRQKQINEEHKKINGELRERVKELEEELEKANKQLDLDYVDENFIPKQVVIDVVNGYKDKIERYDEYREQGKETDVEYYENITNTIVAQVLQELLEGEK